MTPLTQNARRRSLRALIAAPMALLLLAAKEVRLTPEETIRRWADGPVRYLMTAQEEETLRGLKTREALVRFINQFWARRDPSAGTFENEYRRTYWGRVLEANRRFRDSTTPGWKTDRGKVFILLGEPDEIVADEHPRVDSSAARSALGDRTGDSGIRGIERWTYRRRYARAASPEFVIAFVRDESLDWKLSGNPDLLRPEFPGSSTTDGRDPSFGGMENRTAQNMARSAAASGSSSTLPTTSDLVASGGLTDLDTSLFANYDLGLELMVPSNTELVLATVSARAFLTAFPASLKFEYFRAQDGSTFVNIGGLVEARHLRGDAGEGVSQLRVYASLTPDKEGAAPLYATNELNPVLYDIARGPEPGGLVDIWTGLAVPPGRYRASVAIEDSRSGRLGRTDAELAVPAFPEGELSLSSLVLASSISDSGGRLGVANRASGLFLKSETFGVYYEVYGLPAVEEGVLFDSTFRFHREVEGEFHPIGKPVVLPDRTEAAQGWSFALEGWPAGQFRIELTVTDAAGRSAVAESLFRVGEDQLADPDARTP